MEEGAVGDPIGLDLVVIASSSELSVMSRVLVIGGGIGGLTLAVALRAKGLDAEVYEAAPALKPVGKGIWVPTNAMQVLGRIGLADAVTAEGCSLQRIQVRTTGGATLMDVDVTRFAVKYGHPTISIHRADLVRVLSDALPPGTVHLGKRLVDFSPAGESVTARFADGGAATGDVLVGADGLRSLVRDKLFPGVGLRYGGQTCYRGAAGMTLPPDLGRTCWEVWGGAARFGFSAVGRGEVYWFAPVSAPAGSPLPSGPALTDELDARYAGFPFPIPEILRNTPPEEIIRTDLYDIPPIARWWAGRVALLGDAAHATTPNLGQGGAQAVEDAYVLADRLAALISPEKAFAEYQRLRKPKADWVARTARRLGKAAHWRLAPLRWVRDCALRLTPCWLNDRQVDTMLRLNY